MNDKIICKYCTYFKGAFDSFTKNPNCSKGCMPNKDKNTCLEYLQK